MRILLLMSNASHGIDCQKSPFGVSRNTFLSPGHGTAWERKRDCRQSG